MWGDRLVLVWNQYYIMKPKEKMWGTWQLAYYIPLFEKVGGRVFRVPHFINCSHDDGDLYLQTNPSIDAISCFRLFLVYNDSIELHISMVSIPMHYLGIFTVCV